MALALTLIRIVVRRFVLSARKRAAASWAAEPSFPPRSSPTTVAGHAWVPPLESTDVLVNFFHLPHLPLLVDLLDALFRRAGFRLLYAFSRQEQPEEDHAAAHQDLPRNHL